MKRVLLFGVVVTAAAFVIWRAIVTQEVADLVDRGTRPLGEVTNTAPGLGPIYFENDSYYWLLMAERMREEDAPRIRWTDADNAPIGRPVYWSQSIAWLIRLVAQLPGISSQPHSLVTASYWVNPLLEITTLFLLVWLLAPFGVPTVVLVALLFLGLGDVAWAFSTLRPDHQSLQAASTIIAVTALLRVGFGFGIPQISRSALDPTPTAPTLWPFAVAGTAVGIGFWVSAAALMPFLIVLVGSVGVAATFNRPADLATTVRGWRIFGVAAGAVSLGFWLVEFFPDLSATRLEVNNPALSLWAALLGVTLAALFKLIWADSGNKGGLVAGLLLVGGLCCLLPAAIIFGPESWYQPRVASMDRLHNFILEFYTFSNLTNGNVLFSLTQKFQLILPISICLALPVFCARCVYVRATTFVLFLLLAGLFLMFMRQNRWLAIFAPLLAVSSSVAVVWICSSLWSYGHRCRTVAVLLFLGAVAQGLNLARATTIDFSNVSSGGVFFNQIVPAVLNKRFAVALASSPERPTAIMADPSLAPAIAYFARIPVVGSFYWENVAGVEDSAAFFGALDPQDAAAIASKRKISHVIVPSGPLFPNYFDFVQHGHYDTARAKRTLASTLTEGSPLSLPAWLEIDDEIDKAGKAPFVYEGEVLEQYLNVYRVNPEKLREALQRQGTP
jgi:hypothetical protein